MGKLYGTEADLLNQTDLAFLDSSQVRRRSRGVTLDADEFTADGDGNKVVKAGTVIGVMDGGKYEEVDLGVKSTKSIGAAVDNDLIVLTAKVGGVSGDLISYILTDHSHDSRGQTDVQYDEYLKQVTIHLKNSGAAITATALQVIAAITTGAVAATIEIGAADAKTKLTAKTAGFDGNDLSIILKDPAGADQALAVDYDDGIITVWLATDGASAITSTANQVIAAINADVEVSELVYAETGTGSDGTDVCAAVAETHLAAGGDMPPITAANGTSSDGSGAVSEETATYLAGGGDQNVVAKYVTAETVEVTDGDAVVGVFDQARLRVGALVTTLDVTAKAQLVAAGFTLV